MPTAHLFVYGTLRRSPLHAMHALLRPASFVGPGEFQGRLYDLGDYPGAVASDDPADIVHGEVYLLHDPPATLARLDQYEGCNAAAATPTEYVRVVASIRLLTGEFVRAKLYLYQRPVGGCRRIDSGDYLDGSVPPAPPRIS